jgi:hypothetical protein
MALQEIDWETAGQKAEQLYRERIRPTLTEADIGRFVVIDVVNWEYEIDDEDLAATMRLEARNSNCRTYAVRVGYTAAYSIGWHEEPKL